MKRRHRADSALAAVADDWNDILTVLIGEDDLRSQQVRPALIAAAQVGAVAGATAHAVQCPAARDHRWIARRALLLRKVGALAAALPAGRRLLTTTAPLLSRTGRRILSFVWRTALDGCPQHSRHRRRNPCLSHRSQMINEIAIIRACCTRDATLENWR
jgi:hypothetical protein